MSSVAGYARSSPFTSRRRPPAILGMTLFCLAAENLRRPQLIGLGGTPFR